MHVFVHAHMHVHVHVCLPLVMFYCEDDTRGDPRPDEGPEDVRQILDTCTHNTTAHNTHTKHTT